MTQTFYAHMNNKKIKIKKKDPELKPQYHQNKTKQKNK
jgi:hypothetical protein